MLSKKASNIKNRKVANDVVYTPTPLAINMINAFTWKDDEIVLDPCRGKGVFYNNLPTNVVKKWCEISEDKDFF
jgi:hypothetical protein